ncbi:MAG: VOC family protein [Nocardia sp.]|nr:VOC family protein [Nocardia sp.]
MTEPITPRSGDPNWIDLATTDADASIAFYTELFGWTAVRDANFGGYITFSNRGKPIAGGIQVPADTEGARPQWTVYLHSDDARATVEAAEAHGGSVAVAPADVGELGVFAVLTDSAGVGVGVWQPKIHRGFEARGYVADGVWSDHDGNPSWFELHTRGYRDSLEFYREVYGWQDPFTIGDTPEFRYTTIHSTSPMLGGVMDATAFLPEGVPGYWSVYFGADDVDATVRKLESLGGTVLHPAENTTYGRIVAVTDPQGARFSIGGNKQ